MIVPRLRSEACPIPFSLLKIKEIIQAIEMLPPRLSTEVCPIAKPPTLSGMSMKYSGIEYQILRNRVPYSSSAVKFNFLRCNIKFVVNSCLSQQESTAISLVALCWN